MLKALSTQSKARPQHWDVIERIFLFVFSLLT